MKKTFFRSLMAVAVIATLLMAGCQKDTSTLRARIGHFGDDAKVYMSGNNSATPTWSNGDTIWIDHANMLPFSFADGSFTGQKHFSLRFYCLCFWCQKSL